MNHNDFCHHDFNQIPTAFSLKQRSLLILKFPGTLMALMSKEKLLSFAGSVV